MAWKTGLRAKCIVILVVAVCFLLTLPPSLVSGLVFSVDLWLFNFEPDVTDCLDTESSSNKYFVMFLLTWLVTVFLIEILTAALIIKTVVGLQGSDRARIVKSTCTVEVTVCLFYLCWIPAAVWMGTLFGKQTYDPPKWFTFIAVEMVAINSGLSFFIYYKTMPKFSSMFKGLIGSAANLLSQREESSTEATSV